MTYKEFKQFNLKIPKGWRCIRMGEKLGNRWKYSVIECNPFTNNIALLKEWNDCSNWCADTRFGMPHKNNYLTLYIKPK